MVADRDGVGRSVAVGHHHPDHLQVVALHFEQELGEGPIGQTDEELVAVHAEAD